MSGLILQPLSLTRVLVLLCVAGTCARVVSFGQSGDRWVNTDRIFINDNGPARPYPSSIYVDLPGNVDVSCVQVRLLGLAHRYPQDVDILLVSPGGQHVLLMSDAGGGSPVTNVTLTLDSAAATRIAEKGYLTSGSFRPASYEGDDDLLSAPAPGPPHETAMSAFHGGPAAGEWRLFVVDDTASDSGYLNGGWELFISTCGTLSIDGSAVGSIIPEGAVTLTLTEAAPNCRFQSVEFFTDGPVPAGMDVDGHDGWSITVPHVAPGTYSMRAVATDDLGRTCEVCPRDVTVRRVLHVTSLADRGSGSLREAIETASDPDFIDFALTGTITLTSGPVAITKSLTLTGPGANLLGISGNDASPVMLVLAGTTSISGLTFRNGRAEGPGGSPERNGLEGKGGGIYNQATLSLEHCVVSHNRATGGGGGGTDWGLAGDGGRGWGGGVFNSGTLFLTDCVLTGNSVVGGAGGEAVSGFAGGGGNGLGGGICNVGGTLNLVRCQISTSLASGGPGGLASAGGFDAAGGQGYGGALYTDGTATLQDCTTSGNTALAGPGRGGVGSGAGGGIYNVGSLMLSNCTVASNVATGSAFDFAGGIHDEGLLTLRSCTVTGNSAGFAGGLYTGGADVGNTILAGNTDTGGNPDASGTILSSDYNLIQDTGGVTLTGVTNHSIIGRDPLLGPLADYGGPTPTLALSAGSAAIDQGKSFGRSADQRGSNRHDDSEVANPAGGDGSDIGAYEVPELRIRTITRTGSDAQLSYTTALGRTYRLERRDDWGGGTWIPDVDILTGNGGVQQTTVTKASSLHQQFYRVRRLPWP